MLNASMVPATYYGLFVMPLIDVTGVFYVLKWNEGDSNLKSYPDNCILLPFHCLAKELSQDVRIAYCLSLHACLVRNAKCLWLLAVTSGSWF